MTQRLGPWEILGAIAQGGQGAVLRGRDPASGVPVAVKVLLRQDPKSLRRFKQEAQVLDALDHPGIVRVLGHGVENNVPWLAMALVEGESLRARVERGGPLEWREACRVVARLARALAHAHEKGVVHRDLKPDNVLLDARTGDPVLVDFGLLRRDAEQFGELSIDAHSRLSRTGELRGTPAYMAPEQASPQRFGAVGPQTDVFGLGGVLCYLLTAQPPHVADSLPNLIYKLLDCDDVVDVSAVRPDVPAAVSREVRRALARPQAERHPGAAALAAALEGLLDPARPPAPAGSRRPLVLALGLLAGVLAAAGAVVLTLLARRDRPAPPVMAVTPAPPAPTSPAPADDAPAPARPAPGAVLLEVDAAGEGGGNRATEARALWVDDARFATWGKGFDRVALWSVEGRELARWDDLPTVEDVRLVGGELVVLTRHRPLHTLPPTPGATPRARAAPGEGLLALDVLPDGRVVAGNAGGRLFLLASLDAAPGALEPAHRSPVRAVRASADGRWLATSSGRSFDDASGAEADNRLLLRDGRTLAVVAEHAFAGQPVSLAFSPDGRRLAIGTTGYQLFLIDLQAPAAEPAQLFAEDTSLRTGGFVAPPAHGASVRALAFLPDGDLASGSGEWANVGKDASLRHWDLAARRERAGRRLVRDGDCLLSLDVRPDGRLLVGSLSGKVTVLAPW